MLKYSVIPLLIACSSVAVADHRHYSHSTTRLAWVTQATPIYERVSYSAPQEHCWQETVAYEERRSNSAPIIGAILGGALGNELGHHKSNKRVGTVVGAVLGATVATDISHRRSGSHYETVNRCEIQERREWREEIVGYNVSYRYQGEIYHTRLPYNPGKQIEIDVNVTPRG
ncbi:glycine zipper 2TM domain-containing protein [Zhongshania guokunii]|uniref:Glycine zipper 2TM domain-containing protein n=1 Tax=Zhongshania guokunii TaxID=641783 RepID=A0ABV3U6I0_9GAMM